VTDREIDQALERAARAPDTLPRGLLERITEELKPTLRPVRPLRSSGQIAGGLFLITAAVAALVAAHARYSGFNALNPTSRVAIFGLLTVLALLAASHAVAEWIPGSRRRFNASSLVTATCAVLLGVFAMLFRDYHTEHFLAAGLNCLSTGMLYGAVSGVLGVWWLRRGTALNPSSAGTILGLLAGLSGVTLLELQCTNFEALHVVVWHTLVVPVSALLGAALGYGLRARPSRWG
jgi:hypothetical protein